MNLNKIMAVMLSLMMACTGVNFAAAGTAFAAESQAVGMAVTESGQCGSKVTWTLDGEGTLTLSGTGSVYTFKFDSTNGTVYREIKDSETGEVKERVPNPFSSNDKIKKVVVEQGITSLGNYLFYDCRSLTEVQLPSSLKTVGSGTFRKCAALEGIQLPEKVTKIGSSAFMDATALKKIVIPEGVTSLGDSTFRNCTSLEEITIPAGATSWGKHVFRWCSSLTTVEIPQGVTALKDYVFYHCSALKDVKIPDSVESIGAYAFSQCDALAYLDLPASVQEIGKYAFYENNILKEIVIPEGVPEIGEYAFKFCEALEHVTIPSSVKTIGNNAFQGCIALKQIVIPEGVEVIEKTAFRECRYLEEITLPSTLKELRGYALFNCHKLKEINLPEGLTVLGEYALYGLSEITEVTVPDGISEIEQFTFYGCKNLEAVRLPEAVTAIASNAFVECNQLKTLIIPATVTTLAVDGLPETVKLYCSKGSAAEAFALENGRRYAYVGGTEADNLIKGAIQNGDAKAEWTVNRDSETMIMTWNGKMADYTVDTQPWKDVRDYMTVVELFGNVDKLGADTFAKCAYLKVLKIYNRNCDISALKLPEGVTIYGFSGSTAEAFASAKGCAFAAMDDFHVHSFDQGVETKASTCITAGEKLFTCDICQYTKTEPLPLLQHQYGNTLTPADFEREGVSKTVCSLCGDITASRTIAKISEVSLSAEQAVYTGKVQMPELVIRDADGEMLTEADFDAVWDSDCKSVGIHQIRITFKGDYAGSAEKTFLIVPKKTSSVKAVLYGYDDVKFSWNKAAGASGYLVSYKKAGAEKWSKAVSTTKTSYKKANLASGTKYTFRVVPYYKTDDGTKCYDETQYKSTTVYTLKKVTGVKAAKSGSKVKVSWTNINGETGYQISKMTTKSATQKKPLTVKSSSAKYKKLAATKGKTYYYKVRAYKVVDGKKIYGPWSDVKSFKRK